MVADATELQARLNTLRVARHAGFRRVRFADREIEYRSDAELAAAIGDLESQIEAATGRRASVIHFSTSKGL